ncbi:MAG: alanine racemase, partial [Clostridia bacterium]|nr:alanine racemase [Clostridia bacterium]
MSLPIICEVSLKNLNQNAERVKSLIDKRTKFYAVVKSDAYGHGLVGVANSLYTLVDGYCVSLANEALTLRLSGIDKEILLLTPADKEQLENLVLKDITLTVCDKRQVIEIAEVCQRLSTTASVQIKLNTGMNRLGASTINEVGDILNIASQFNLNVTGAYSHLGDSQNKRYAKEQRSKFIALSDAVKNYYENACLHLSASGGILLGKDYEFNAVRSGLMLYGYLPYKTSLFRLDPVMKV